MALAGPAAERDDGAMVTPTLTDQLGRTWFAADIPPGALERLAALGRIVDFEEGAVVITEGMPCPSLGVVVDGRIALRLSLPGGEDRTILTVEVGDVIGWSAVLPPAIATSTGIAVAPTRVIAFDGASLRAALQSDCELGAAVYERLLVGVARRLMATRTQLLDLYRPGGEAW